MKEEDKKYLTAFLVGAVILIILRELFDKSKKRTSDYVATGLIGGALGAGAYALCRKKEKEEAYEVDLREMIEWRNKNWAASSSIITLSKIYKRKFAAESLKNGFLDLARYYELDKNCLYRITYENQDNYLTPGKILFNAEELRYFAYGYITARMNLTYYEALFAAVNFFDRG